MGDTTQLFVLNPGEVTQAYELPEDKIKIMKDFCDKITIADVNDKENYKLASQALTRVRKTRTGIEAKRKELKEPFLEAGKLIDAEAKRLTALILPIEASITEKVARIDQEAARIEGERRKWVDEQMRVAWYIKQSGVFVVGKMIVSEDEAYKASAEQLDSYIKNGLAAKATEEAEKAELDRLRKLAEEQTKPVTFETKQHGETTVNLPKSDPFAGLPPVVPATTPQPTAPATTSTTTPIEQFRPGYLKGFEACKTRVLEVLNSPDKLTRAQWIERINNLKA